MTIYTYTDAFLKKYVTDDVEQRADEWVTQMYGTFDAAWTERLVVARAYITVCTEHQAQADDLFVLKLKTYEREFSALLTQAEASRAAAAEPPESIGFFTVPLERG